MQTITIGNTDEDADWLKQIGNAKQQDLQATQDALQQHKAKKQGKISNLLQNLRKNK